MKFTITSITEEGVMGLSDNPHRKPTKEQFGWHSSGWQIEGGEEAHCELLDTWQEAEANRKEYKIDKTEIIDMTIIEGDFDYRIGNQGISYLTELGDQIEGDIKDNQIVNIKII